MFKLAQFRKRDKGNQQVQKYRPVPKLASESSTSSHATTEEHLVMFQAEQRSQKGVTGKPMKNLLADEMSKEVVAKKKSPSVIAKLMGLDGAGQRQLRLWDKYTKRTASVGADRNEKPHDSKSSRKNWVGKHGLKGVFNYREAPNVADRRKSSKQSGRVIHMSKAEIALMRRKRGEILRESNEIKRQMRMRRKSNQDLMDKFLQQPDSLFVKHVLDQQGRTSSSQCSHIAVLRPTNSIESEANAKGWKAERETSHMDSYRRQDDELLERSRGCGTHTSLRSSKVQLEAKEETAIPPRRIIVLKPSFGQTDKATQCVSSADDFRKQDLAISTREAGSWAEKTESDDTKFSCHKCREARETAKEITRQMRDSFVSLGNLHGSMGKSGVRGYAGEESSYMSDSESEAVITLTSRNFYSDWYDHNNPPLPRAAESSASREAKMRMSERWKMTHGYIDVEGIAQGSTLGEMLSTPDRQMRSENLNAVKGLDRTRRGAAYATERDTPMGISSRDGWKDGYLGSSLRSGSVPPSFGSRRHKSSEHLEVPADERLLIHREARTMDRGKAVMGHISQRESSNLRSNNMKPHPYQSRHAFTSTSTDPRPRIISSQRLIAINFGVDGLAEEEQLVPRTPDGVSSTPSVGDSSSELLPLLSPSAQIDFEIDDVSEETPLLPQTPDGISTTASVVDAKPSADTIMLPDPSSELIPLLSECALGDADSSALYGDVSTLQGPSNGEPEGDSDSLQIPRSSPEPEPEAEAEPETETSEISKEAHHSPDSVLAVPSKDASPESDSFGRVSADLQELRLQLQQLKRESDEGYMIFSDGIEADEEQAFDEEGSVGSFCWKDLYIIDLLVESGLYGTDPGSFILNCYSADCPLDPSLFESLEKKYSDDTTGPRSVRKLLYAHTNELLLEIYHSVMDSFPWVKLARKGVGLKWQTGRLEDQLEKVMEIHEEEAKIHVDDTVIDKHPGWLEPREAVDALGKQIQEMLLDDLITELVLNM